MPEHTAESHQLSDLANWAVIFDMDGTLVATTEADFLAWQRLFGEYGHPLSYQDYYPLLGRKSADVVREGLELEGVDAEKAMARKMAIFADIVAEKGVETLPDVHDLLVSLKQHNIRMALATSSRKQKMELVMQTSALYDYFDVFVTGEEVQEGKPAPQIFLLAASRLGIEPSRCIVVEDTISGIKAALAAGMACVAIASTHESIQLQSAHRTIHHYNELTVASLRQLLP